VNSRKLITIFVHAFVGWALYRAITAMGIPISILRSPVFHVIGLPIFFVVVSLIYFKKFNYTAPLLTAVIFVGFVMVVDFFAVALLNIKNLGIYYSLPRTWFRFALIFVSTYLTGFLTTRSSKSIAQNASVVAVCGITSALGSGIFGFFIDVWGWGMYESAVFGAYIGFFVGLFVGISWSIYLLEKRYATWKVIRNALFVSLFISGLFVVVSTIITTA